MLPSFTVLLFCCCIALQWSYGLYFFIRIFFLKKSKSPTEDAIATTFVTVLICAKNEAAALQRHLPEVLAQRYMNASGKPNYEVVVVNDGSSDDTAAVLEALSAQYAHLRVVTIPADAPRTAPGKKHALACGLEQIRGQMLLLTDADCRPAGPHWLAAMTGPLSHGKVIVAGYGGYEKAPGLLNALIRWETLHTFLQYASYAAAGLPYMAVGRNLACTKDALLRAMRLPAWRALPSGDDDLLVRAVANRHNTRVVADPQAFTISTAKDTWRGWLQQKQRHLSTGKFYRSHMRGLLAGYAFTHAGTWLLFIILLFSGNAPTALLLMIPRCLLYWSAWYATARRTGEQGLTPLFPVFDFGWMIYNFVLSPYIIWKNKDRWT
jgi:glycosyltransferase involved in cell wall biosynthesis